MSWKKVVVQKINEYEWFINETKLLPELEDETAEKKVQKRKFRE